MNLAGNSKVSIASENSVRPPSAGQESTIKNAWAVIAIIAGLCGLSPETPSVVNKSGVPRLSYHHPLPKSCVSSAFSSTRVHPILGIPLPHYGIDLAAPAGTPVYAIASAIVLKASYSRTAGNFVVLLHSQGISSSYMHLAWISPKIRRGGRVNQGQVIGAVGKTGLANGPHLHFSLHDGSRYLKPLPQPPPCKMKDLYITASSKPLSKKVKNRQSKTARLSMAKNRS